MYKIKPKQTYTNISDIYSKQAFLFYKRLLLCTDFQNRKIIFFLEEHLKKKKNNSYIYFFYLNCYC